MDHAEHIGTKIEDMGWSRAAGLPGELSLAPRGDFRERLRARVAAAVAALRSGSQRGMTLIEIMVVMAIIGIIGTVIAINVIPAQKDAEVNACKVLVTSTIPTAVNGYRALKQEYPDSLEILVEQKKLNKKQLNDPWNKPLTYEVTGDDFRLCSSGPDKVAGSKDDICNTDGE
jgi:general secretion pathway protein G